MDDSVMHFVKDWLWAPLLGLVAWAWQRNEREHEMLWKTTQDLQSYATNVQSSLHDRFASNMDDRMREMRTFVKEEDNKLSEEILISRTHIAKLFDKLEEHGKRSEDRHFETLKEIRDLSNAMHKGLAQKADK